eukprot:995467-Rhodomonas_salina.2
MLGQNRALQSEHVAAYNRSVLDSAYHLRPAQYRKLHSKRVGPYARERYQRRRKAFGSGSSIRYISTGRCVAAYAWTVPHIASHACRQIPRARSVAIRYANTGHAIARP